MSSHRFQILVGRIIDLRKCLLPLQFSPTGVYDNDDHVRIKSLSFRVLTHAEVESYFEDRVIEVAKNALAAWRSRNTISRSLVHILAFSGSEMELPPSTIAAPSPTQAKSWPSRISIDERIENATTKYIRGVTVDNHGIREKNLISMLLPVGVDVLRIDPIFLANMDNFGKKRGDAAHQSTSVQVTTGIDPKDEFQNIVTILAGIKLIDEQLDKLIV